MKKLIITIVCMLIVNVVLYAQKNNNNFTEFDNSHLDLQQVSTQNNTLSVYCKPVLIKLYSNNQNVKTIKYKYNSSGYLLAELTQISPELQHRTLYTYEKNRIINKSVDTLNNYKFQNYERYNYKYDNNGNLESELVERKIENNWLNYTKNIYNYDCYGNITEKTRQKWINDKWENHIQYKNTYNNQNNLLSQTSAKWLNNIWVNDSLCFYSYDFFGLLLSKVNNVWWNGTWVKTNRDRFQYNTLGYMVSYFYETYNSDNLWNTIESFNCINDSAGNLLTAYKYQNFGNNYNLEIERFDYTYDTNNNCVSASHINTMYGKMFFPFISNPPAEMDIYSNNYNNKISLCASKIDVSYSSINESKNILKKMSVSAL
ncbi:MAG: hypothetical protein V1773_10035 [bacterium]